MSRFAHPERRADTAGNEIYIAYGDGNGNYSIEIRQADEIEGVCAIVREKVDNQTKLTLTYIGNGMRAKRFYPLKKRHTSVVLDAEFIKDSWPSFNAHPEIAAFRKAVNEFHPGYFEAYGVEGLK